MLTGQKPFQGKSQLSVASAILEKEPEPINSLKPMTPPALDHAIRRCLAKDPDERWQTGRDPETATPTFSIWKWNMNASNPEKLVDQCGIVFDSDLSGQYLLAVELGGEKTGIYAVSISEKKCVPLLTGVVTFTATFAPDSKSFLYAVAHRGEVTIFRQPWSNGKVIGTPQVALKVPFAFPLAYQGGNAYAFSRDLSTIVYAPEHTET